MIDYFLNRYGIITDDLRNNIYLVNGYIVFVLKVSILMEELTLEYNNCIG